MKFVGPVKSYDGQPNRNAHSQIILNAYKTAKVIKIEYTGVKTPISKGIALFYEVKVSIPLCN